MFCYYSSPKLSPKISVLSELEGVCEHRGMESHRSVMIEACELIDYCAVTVVC